MSIHTATLDLLSKGKEIRRPALANLAHALALEIARWRDEAKMNGARDDAESLDNAQRAMRYALGQIEDVAGKRDRAAAKLEVVAS